MTVGDGSIEALDWRYLDCHSHRVRRRRARHQDRCRGGQRCVRGRHRVVGKPRFARGSRACWRRVPRRAREKSSCRFLSLDELNVDLDGLFDDELGHLFGLGEDFDAERLKQLFEDFEPGFYFGEFDPGELDFGELDKFLEEFDPSQLGPLFDGFDSASSTSSSKSSTPASSGHCSKASTAQSSTSSSKTSTHQLGPALRRLRPEPARRVPRRTPDSRATDLRGHPLGSLHRGNCRQK